MATITIRPARQQCPSKRVIIFGIHNSQSPSWTMRSGFNLFLISLMMLAWAATAVATAADTEQLDDKSLAMANRIIQKVKDRQQPDLSPSTTMLLRVLENSFLGAATTTDNNSEIDVVHYHSAPSEEEGRERALRWLAHEDAHDLSDGQYDRGLLERYALATIYFATGGDGWNRCARRKDGGGGGSKQSDSICESDAERYLSPHSHLKWSGINGKDGKITWLNLSDQGLVSAAFLPLEATLFGPTLELFWVSENEKLAGTLPDYLGEFRSLVSLSVHKTSVSGALPESMYGLSKLSSIRLYKSKFTGAISTNIGGLEALKWFWIHDNEFTGSIPENIGELSKLEGVTLHGNKFGPAKTNDGEKRSGLEHNLIPEALCSLRASNLKHLWTDCEEGAVVPPLSREDGKEAKFVVKEGVKACSCCTKCFPRKDEMRSGQLSIE